MLKALGAIALVMLLCGFLWLGWYASQKFFSKDYSEQSSGDVFKQVVGAPVPQGVTEVVVKGHTSWQTSMIWLKITGAPKSLLALTKNMSKVQKASFHYSPPESLHGNLAADATAAGWGDVPNLKDPQFFIFRNKSDSEQWIGSMVVSPKTHTAYVSAQKN